MQISVEYAHRAGIADLPTPSEDQETEACAGGDQIDDARILLVDMANHIYKTRVGRHWIENGIPLHLSQNTEQKADAVGDKQVDQQQGGLTVEHSPGRTHPCAIRRTSSGLMSRPSPWRVGRSRCLPHVTMPFHDPLQVRPSGIDLQMVQVYATTGGINASCSRADQARI